MRGLHLNLVAAANDNAAADDDGGLQQQRHPGLPEDSLAKANTVEPTVEHGFDDDSDVAADKAVMDRLRDLGTVGSAHAMNEGDLQRNPDHDLMPDF